PFQAKVLTPVIGRKPGSRSFPSGHSAAAFAGAWLLSKYFRRWRPAFVALATLVCFSRLYLGVHYLSDVVMGAISGAALAAGYRIVVGAAIQRATSFARGVRQRQTVATGEMSIPPSTRR